MKRAEQIVSVIAWTILASLLFALFGVFFAHAVASTLVRLEFVSESGSEPTRDVFRSLAGLGMLAISLVYRRLAGSENAGSLAAWLAGWALLLYSVASLASLVEVQAAPVVLLTVLGVWTAYRLTKYFARYDPGGHDDEG